MAASIRKSLKGDAESHWMTLQDYDLPFTLWLCQQLAIENGPVEIVSFPINSMVIFHSYVRLPEGMSNDFGFPNRFYGQSPLASPPAVQETPRLG